MGNLLSFCNHIEKKQTKAQYLAYEKGKVLEETIISGIKTTIPYQMAIMENEIFKSGNFDTSFLETFNYDSEKYAHKDEK